mmetsp:Transcript_10726/g.10847  ORF Transcript_10726/g.10847 Transcript_10726/m.10847 type:complete len:89 (+) Transcript_10726:1130-1396(+)
MAEKQAQKLMSESGNMFEEFVKRLFFKFGKLQIDGFHTKTQSAFRIHRSVSPGRRQQHMFQVNSQVKSRMNAFNMNENLENRQMDCTF